MCMWPHERIKEFQSSALFVRGSHAPPPPARAYSAGRRVLGLVSTIPFMTKHHYSKVSFRTGIWSTWITATRPHADPAGPTPPLPRLRLPRLGTWWSAWHASDPPANLGSNPSAPAFWRRRWLSGTHHPSREGGLPGEPDISLKTLDKHLSNEWIKHPSKVQHRPLTQSSAYSNLRGAAGMVELFTWLPHSGQEIP